MAEIVFSTKDDDNIAGSGLGFYGTTFGSSVQIGEYQDTTFIVNDDGSQNKAAAANIKFLNFESGNVESGNQDGYLGRINSSEATLKIDFLHGTPVNVQNVQLRIYDRVSINNPASGVLTKVAELVNFDNDGQGSNASTGWTTWKGAPGDEVAGVSGSGDLFWWGAPWPAAQCNLSWHGGSTNYAYKNSSGVKFYNFTDAEVGNGDARLTGLTGAQETVGGTGIIVPLLNSPGSGGKNLHMQYALSAGGELKPKYMQYYKHTDTPGGSPNIGANQIENTYGGTGVDTRHTWHVALSASPISIGSKTDYGLYVSLEYL